MLMTEKVNKNLTYNSVDCCSLLDKTTVAKSRAKKGITTEESDRYNIQDGKTLSQVCNGSADICGRRYDEVTFPGTHNSMSYESGSVFEGGWYNPKSTI